MTRGPGLHGQPRFFSSVPPVSRRAVRGKKTAGLKATFEVDDVLGFWDLPILATKQAEQSGDDGSDRISGGHNERRRNYRTRLQPYSKGISCLFAANQALKVCSAGLRRRANSGSLAPQK